jgi:ribosomal-protein-alanine N-acetyltransferase
VAAIAQLRLATRADAAGIARMSRDYIEQGLPWSWTPERVLRAITDRSSNVVLAAARSGVLGFGIMYYGEDSAHLALLAVQPAHRQQGWGGRLLAWLMQPAQALDLRCVLVEARSDNPRAIAFYERHGFSRRATITGYYRGSIDAVRLERPLRPPIGDPMSSPVQIEREQEIGVFRLEGAMSLEQAVGLGSAAMALARAQQLPKLLILAGRLELPEPPGVLQRYRIGERWAEAAGGVLSVALVTRAELIDPQKFAVTVAMNRGARADVFDSEPAARAWLAQLR